MSQFIYRNVNLKVLLGAILLLVAFGAFLIHFTPPNPENGPVEPGPGFGQPPRRGPSQDNRTSHNKYIV